MPGRDLPQAQGIVEGERMGDAALVGFGSDHPDVVRQRAGDRLEGLQPRRVTSVVVRQENAHANAMRVVRCRDNYLRPPRNNPQLNRATRGQFLLRRTGLTMSALGIPADPS